MSKSDRNKGNSQVAAFVGDAETEMIAAAVFEDLGFDGAGVKRGDVGTAITFLTSNPSPRIIIVDISRSELPISDINALAEACEPGVEVIVVGAHNDIGLFRDLMQIGVSDYLAKPVTRELLRRSIETVRQGAHSVNLRGRLGKIVAVTGVRGGAGATTVAANLAWLLSEKVGRRVALLDLDFNYGALSLALDQRATPGLREALENIHRVDQLFIERTLTNVNSRLALLSCEEPLDYKVSFETKAYDELVGQLAKQFHYVMVDVPDCSGIEHLHVLKMAAVRILVLDPTLSSMRHTIRLLKALGHEEVGRQTILVLNRRWPQSDGDLSIEEIEKALNHRIDVTIPFGKSLFVTAENAGELVVAKPSPVTDAFTDLVQELSGRPRTKTTLLQRLMKKATSPFQGGQSNLITLADRGNEPELPAPAPLSTFENGAANGAGMAFKTDPGNVQPPPKQ
ncbi:MAG TPA: AAA family ATPase [Alphaproteobacteria bacterium]|nr:AAA family ATPase [Alphaproteobacteria bacterium]